MTIVSFEKELVRLKQQELNLLNNIQILEQKPQSPSAKQVSTEANNSQKSVETLKSECSTYKFRLSEQDELIKSLRRDLAGASAKLSDTHGEMTDKQKRELEKNRQLILDQQKELSVTRAQLAKLSEIVEKQTKQLDSVNPELKYLNFQFFYFQIFK